MIEFRRLNCFEYKILDGGSCFDGIEFVGCPLDERYLMPLILLGESCATNNIIFFRIPSFRMWLPPCGSLHGSGG